MKTGPSRAAFTVVEMMVATSIFALVVGGVGTFIVGSYRMTKGTFARVSLSMQIRETRERLLFRAIPTHDGTIFAGILSGTNASGTVVEPQANPIKILMTAGGVKTDGTMVSPSSRNLQLIRDGGAFQNDDYRAGSAWLRPMAAEVVPATWLSLYSSVGKPKAIAVTLGGVVDGVGLTNTVTVPIFGTIQPPQSSTALWGSDW